MEYPYMISNNKISSILEKIKTAAKPSKFTHELLKKMGFNNSNDRAIIPLLKRLGFLSEDGSPTEYYDQLRDNTQHQYILGERIKELYNDLFQINTTIYSSSDEEIKGAISRVTGKDEKSVNRYFATFKALTNLAKFDSSIIKKTKEPEKKAKESEIQVTPPIMKTDPQFHYNIQIHLPATTDISVYNAIFKSLKENLM